MSNIPGTEIGKENEQPEVESTQTVEQKPDPLLKLTEVVQGLAERVEELKKPQEETFSPSPTNVPPAQPDIQQLTQQEQDQYTQIALSRGDFAANQWLAQHEAQKYAQNYIYTQQTAQQKVRDQWNKIKASNPQYALAESQFMDVMSQTSPSMINDQTIAAAAELAFGRYALSTSGKSAPPPQPKEPLPDTAAPTVTGKKAELSEEERKWAKHFRMSDDQYAKRKQEASIAEGKRNIK